MITDLRTIIQDLEEKEQEFIGHLRISGLTQQRETRLIDEVLSIRKRRRQFISDLSKKLNDYEQKVISSQELLKLADLNARKLEEKYSSTISEEIQKKDIEMKSEISSISQRYEMKLKSLEEKLQMLSVAKQVADNDEITEKVKQITESKIAEIESRNYIRLESYKKAIVGLKNNEKELRDIIHKKNEQLQEFHEKLEALKQTNTNLEESLRNEKYKFDQIETELNKKNGRLHDMTIKYKNFEDQFRIFKERSYSDFRDLTKKRRQELNDIDSKVRAMMHSKDELINTLHNKLENSNQKVVDMEKALSDLTINL